MRVVNNMTEEQSMQVSDDGVSQRVMVKSGVQEVDKTIFKNPAYLRPMRTFTEVEQVESPFVVRFKEGKRAAIFEADGGQWQVEAVRRVGAYLRDSLRKENVDWFVDIYKTSYSDLTSSIKNFMVSSQNMMDAKARRLEDNAYRATMPGFIALVIAIVIVLIFYYFVNLYYITPVLKIDSALKAYLDSKMPFKVTIEGKDEVYRLKERIESLIDQSK